MACNREDDQHIREVWNNFLVPCALLKVVSNSSHFSGISKWLLKKNCLSLFLLSFYYLSISDNAMTKCLFCNFFFQFHLRLQNKITGMGDCYNMMKKAKFVISKFHVFCASQSSLKMKSWLRCQKQRFCFAKLEEKKNPRSDWVPRRVR